MGPAIESSGGSAANTIAGLASFGGQAGFIGKVADDQFGGVFPHDIRSAGVTSPRPPPPTAAPTARCLILVTPDGERTMNTFLGVSPHLAADDLDAALIARAHRLSRGLSVRPAGSEGRVPPGGRHGRQGRPAGGAHPVGRLLRRPPPRRFHPRWSATASTSCSPTRRRSPRSTRSTSSRRRPERRADTRDRGPHPLREGLASSWPGARRSPSPPRRSPRWSTRPAPAISTRRASSAARQRPLPRDCRAPRQPGGGRDHQPHRRPAGDEAGRSGAAARIPALTGPPLVTR